MATMALDDRVAAIRRFNRFYTRRIGVLGEGLLNSPFSLVEARVLYELAHRDQPTAGDLGRDLGLDPGYLSRILKGFERKGLILRTPSETDRRQVHIALTDAGRKAFAPLDTRSRAEIGGMLDTLPETAQRRLAAAMREIEALLGGNPSTVPYVIRPPHPGDFGWVVSRHGALYAQEYGWNESFEALVAEIAATFIRNFDRRHEGGWIAERDGEPVGSVFLVKESDEAAKLRLLIVEPSARGLGIGARLVDECLRFARRAGYRKVTLWTNSVLLAARHIYQKAGFQLVSTEPHHSFGHDLVGEYWTLEL